MNSLSTSRLLQRRIYWWFPALLFLWGVDQAPRSAGIDLLPRPDGLRYALLAYRLARFAPPLIGIGPHDFPSRYALTYPLLLVPFDWIFRGDIGALWIGSAFYGAIATILIALVGARLTGSRPAGGLAAAFFALHPETVAAGALNMSETSNVMLWWASLGLALPWIERGRDPAARRTAWRAAALGLTLGFLTVAKPPFVYWAICLALLVALRGWRIRRVLPALAMVGAGLACALADAVYRRWALGRWGATGYEYWFGEIYNDPGRVFNWRYLFQPSLPQFSTGNLAFYRAIVFGQSGELYAPYAACATLAGAALLLWPGRRGRPKRLVTLLFGGWLVAGALFCGLYFFQASRFLLLWVPVADLLLAWGLVRLWTWPPLRRARCRRFLPRRCAQALAALAALVLARGEILRSAPVRRGDGGRQAIAARMQAMLRGVPSGAWIFTNYELPLVDLYRPAPGPTGVLDAVETGDKWFGKLALEVRRRGLAPRGGNDSLDAVYRDAPPRWRAGEPFLLDGDAKWTLDAAALRATVTQPAWLLFYTPQNGEAIDENMVRVVRPRLEERFDLATTSHTYSLKLFRMTLKD